MGDFGPSAVGGVHHVLAQEDRSLRAQAIGPMHSDIPRSRTIYRPRPRSLPAPSTELNARPRILALTGATLTRTPPQVLNLEPPEAADRLVAQLRSWGYTP